MSYGEDSERDAIHSVALPDEIPPPPRLHTDPNSLHSGTVESLLIQNEDLTARLAVSHRRNGEMERRAREIQCEYSELQKRLEVLTDQILVYREKDKAVKTRQGVFEKNIERLKSQLEMQNIRYADLYNGSKRDLAFLREENEKLTKQMKSLQRYRQRIVTHVAPLIKRQKDKIAEQKTALTDLYRSLEESGEHIKRQKEQLSSERQALRQEIQKLEAELATLHPIQEKYLKLKEERTVHQNRVIAAERGRDDLLIKHREEMHRLQEAVSQYRGESKILKLELQDYQERLQTAESSLKKNQDENERLRDQTESLQALWASTSKKLEASTAKEEALQKLNQEISRQLKTARSADEAQKTDYLRKIEEQEKTIRLLTTELHILKSTKPADKGNPEKPFTGQLADYHFAESEKMTSKQEDLEL